MKSSRLVADLHVYQKWLKISPAHFCKSRQLFCCPTYIYMLYKPVKLIQTSFAIEIVVKIELPIHKNEKTPYKMRVDVHIVPS